MTIRSLTHDEDVLVLHPQKTLHVDLRLVRRVIEALRELESLLGLQQLSQVDSRVVWSWQSEHVVRGALALHCGRHVFVVEEDLTFVAEGAVHVTITSKLLLRSSHELARLHH